MRDREGKLVWEVYEGDYVDVEKGGDIVERGWIGEMDLDWDWGMGKGRGERRRNG